MTIIDEKPEEEIQKILYQHGAVTIEEASSKELYRAVSYHIRETIGRQMSRTEKNSREGMTMVYMSMEYLPGSLMRKNIDYLDKGKSLQEALEKRGCNLRDLILEDRELGLGYSDIGYLSNGLMDTFASGSYNAIGYGLLYREGYFRQEIENFQQLEKPDSWWVRGKNWLYKGDRKYRVTTGGRVDISMGDKGLVFTPADTKELTLRYYDLPYLGYRNGFCNRLRLFDHETITRRIKPLDATAENRRERFKQEYLLVSGALQDVISTHLSNGRELESLNDHFVFLMMDTNLLLAIPEMMRILVDQYKLEWDDAWEITSDAFFYTPLVPLEDTLLTLEGKTFREWLPRLWMVLEEIHHRYLDRLKSTGKAEDGGVESSGILWDDQVRLYNIPGAGVYEGPPIGYPLAVSHRRWILSGNPPLRDLIEAYLGQDFVENPGVVKELLKKEEDREFLVRISEVKERNKELLCQELYRKEGIVLDSNTVFHGYLKDVSASNRQLLMLLWILDQYLMLKDNPNIDMIPRTIFIGGKAAANDFEGKDIIRLASRLAHVINRDRTIKEKLKLIFVHDLSLKKEEFVYPALDITHSLTTPTKGGLHLAGLTAMINGAVAIGSNEETNILLGGHTKDSSMELFGITAEEVERCYNTKEYNSQEYYYLNRDIRRAVDALLGKKDLIDEGEFRGIHDMLLKYNDNNFVLRDFKEYKKRIQTMEADYLTGDKWTAKMLYNIALISEFASDVVVARYAKKMQQTSK
ncbi:glycogen/starch/alpha-glucan phosphorylase [Gudongella sp. SC589]|jgi:starch phosphorylase|uniref:glycogen/starch/alpha-glucan phosphorylase n=1 Tax=Gudongella sp. SC589 TaxID=3385990 RepID=UPI003904747A